MTSKQQPEPKRLRTIVEIASGEVIIFPVADSDADREEILDALRIYFGEIEGRG
jgi:hypothetical protein